jgi:hypothetical protein
VATYATRLMLAQALFAGDGAELGVAGGGFSEDILRYCPAVTLLWSIDRWSDHHDLREYWSAADRLGQYGQRSRVRRCTFTEAAQMIADGSLGWCYLDGYAHTGQDGMQTLVDWWGKLRPGGILAGHDYHADWPATMRVVDEFVASRRLELGLTREYDKPRQEFPSWWVKKR